MCDECSRQVHTIETTHHPKRYNPQNTAIQKKCPEHEIPIEYYIEDEGIVVCSKCLLEKHSGKMYKVISEVSEEKKTYLKGHKEVLEQTISRLNKNLGYLKEELKKEEQNRKETNASLDKWKKDTIEMINRIYQEHKKSVKEYHEEVNADLTRRIENLEKQMDNTTTKVKEIEKSIENWCDEKLTDRLTEFKDLVDTGKKLIEDGNDMSDDTERVETRITLFKQSTKEEEIKSTTKVERRETPNNIPCVKNIRFSDVSFTSAIVRWDDVEKVPEKLLSEPINHSVLLFDGINGESPAKVMPVGRQTSFKIEGLAPAETYKVAIRTAFGSNPKNASQSALEELKTKDVLDPPERIAAESHAYSIAVSWEAPRCLEGRADLLNNVVYKVSIEKNEGGSGVISSKEEKGVLKTSFDGLEEETSYKVSLLCRYRENGKESKAAEAVFRTSKMVLVDYVSEFLSNKTITAEGYAFSPAVADSEGFGILKNPIGKDQYVRVSFEVEKYSTFKIGVIPAEKFSVAKDLSATDDLDDISFFITEAKPKFLKEGVDFTHRTMYMTDIPTNTKSVVTLEINTHSRFIKMYHNGNIVGEADLKSCPKYVVDVFPYIASNKRVVLVSSSRAQFNQQPQQQPQQHGMNPVPYDGKWCENKGFLQYLGTNFVAVTKIGGEKFYGATAIGMTPLAQRTSYAFKVSFATKDKRVRMGLAHKDVLKKFMNNPKLFGESEVVYADFAENRMATGSTSKEFDRRIASAIQANFQICMTVIAESGQIFFDSPSGRLGVIEFKRDFSNFFLFVALSDNCSVSFM